MPAKFPCDVVLPECGCDQNPVRNFSSADPDLPTFTGIEYVALIPPLGTAWGSRNCVGVVVSLISQQDADQQAQNAAITCAVADWRAPTPGTSASPPVPPPMATRGAKPYQVVPNQPQTQTAYCPDGNPFTFTTPAGTFVGVNLSFNQALLIANTKAKSYALEQAQINMVCLGELLTPTCLGEFYSSSITATGKNVSGGAPQDFGNTPDNWEITSGMVPPGLTFHGGPVFGGTVIINGTPTTPGTFMFTVQITDTVGGTMSKDYEISVAGIGNLPIPAATVGTAYVQQLAPAGFNNAPTFALTGGSLPTGLTLSIGGLISGTPTMAQTTSAQVKMTDPDSGLSCTQTVGMTVTGSCGPVPTQQFAPTSVGYIATTLAARPGILLSPDLLAVQQSFGTGIVTTINPHTLAQATTTIGGNPEGNAACYSAVNDRFIFGGSVGGVGCIISRIIPDPLAVQSSTDFSGTVGNTCNYMVYHSIKKLVYAISTTRIFAYDPVANAITGSVVFVIPGDSPTISLDEAGNILWACSQFGVNHFLYKYDISGASPVLLNTYAFPALFGNVSAFFCPGNGLVYCPYIDPGFNDVMARFNPANGLFQNLTTTTSGATSVQPYGFSYNPASKLLFVQAGNLVDVYCAVTDSLISTFNTGQNLPAPSAFGPWDNSNSFVDSQSSPSTVTLYH